MKMIRACYAIYFVVLLIAPALGTSLEGKGTTTLGLFLEDEGVTDPPEAHENVEWIHRRKELIEKGTTKGINFHIPGAESEVINSRLFTKIINDRANCLNGLPPRLREAIMSCLMENGVMFEVLSSEISFGQLFLKCIHLISSWPASRRRLLLGVSSQELDSGSASSISSLTVASSSRGTLQKAAMLEPSPSHMTSLKINSSADALDHKFMIFNMISSVEYHEGGMSFPSSQPSEQPLRKRRLLLQETSEEEEVMEVIIVACAVTAIGTFVSVGLIFCCCVGGGEAINSGSSLRDERPLLNMSMSDKSGGTSQMSNHLGSSSLKDSMAVGVLNNMSTEGSMKHNDLLTVEASSGDETTGDSLLPLPPGRSAPPPAPAPASAPAPAPAPAPSAPPPGPPPPSGPRPPPPPNKGGRAPPPPRGARPSPLGPNRKGKDGASNAGQDEGENGAQKTKLKPFFWDKVLASDDHSMVWRTIQDGSFQLNEEMMENLFGYTVMENRDKKKTTVLESKPKFIQIIDPRKAQNLSILLKALNVTTEEVISALKQGNELPTELLQTLLKTQPTTDEELKLRLYGGELCDLGPAEQFLKLVVEIPSAFKRVEALLFMSSLQEEVINIKECFATLEVACNKLRNSRLFLKLLEAVLKTGNRMNDGTYRGGAQAIKLDTLLKLSDVKGTDGKTTLLLFVVQEIIRSEGIRALRAAKLNKTLSSVSTGDVVHDHNNPDMEDQYRDRGLEMISSLTDELQDVKKAAAVDTDTVATTVSKMRTALAKNSAFLNSEMKTDGEDDNEFSRALSNFVERADADVKWLAVEEERIMALVKSTADYFHGTAGTKEGLRLFVIVRDFLVMLDRVCREVKDTRAKQLAKPVRKGADTGTASTSSDKATQASSLSSSENREPIEEMHKRLFPAIADRRQGGKGDWSSSSDSDSD